MIVNSPVVAFAIAVPIAISPLNKVTLLSNSAVPVIDTVVKSFVIDTDVATSVGAAGAVVSTSIAGTLAGDDGFPAVSVAMTVKL